MSLIAFILALAAYAASAVLALGYVRRGEGAASRWAARLTLAGFAAHSAFLVWWGLAHGRLPAYAPFEALAALLWCVVLVYFVLDLAVRFPALPAFVMPVVAACGVAVVALVRPEGAASDRARSWWVHVHVVTALVGAADFLVAFAVAAMYLVQQHQLKRKSLSPLMERLPSLDALDRLNYRAVSLGMPVFTLALLSGVVLAVEKGPGWWASWTLAASLLVWVVYAVLLHVRLAAGVRGPKVAYLTILGFALVVVAVCGIVFLGDTVHTMRPRGPTTPPAQGEQGGRDAP